MSQSDFDPKYVFEHHSPTPEKLGHFEALHEAARAFAQVILAHTPHSEDQAAALRLLREAHDDRLRGSRARRSLEVGS